MNVAKHSKWADLGLVPNRAVHLEEAKRLVAWGVKRGLLRYPGALSVEGRASSDERRRQAIDPRLSRMDSGAFRVD